MRRWLAYRADRVLAWPPLALGLLIVGIVLSLLAMWALLLRVMYPSDPSARTGSEALFWATTLFLDPGAVTNVRAGERTLALTITATGIVSLSFLTGAIAGAIGARLDLLRSGTTPVVERDHIVVLGFDPKAAWIAREYQQSGVSKALVLLATQSKHVLDASLESVRQQSRAPRTLLTRVGDPRSEAALRNVNVEYAQAVIVVAPQDLSDEQAARWSLETILALRSAIDTANSPTIVVEVRRRAHASLVMLAAEAGVAGERALPVRVLCTEEILARILAQSARQRGVYAVLRALLSRGAFELEVCVLPESLAQQTFASAQQRVLHALVLGIFRRGTHTMLNPSQDEVLRWDDQLIVLKHDYDELEVRAEPTNIAALSHTITQEIHKRNAPVERLRVVGYNETLAPLVMELDHILGSGSSVAITAPPSAQTSAAAQVAALQQRVRSVKLTLEVREPTEPLEDADDTLLSSDAVVILGAEDPTDLHGDASALSYLLWLRHGMRATGKRPARVVTEVQDVRSASKVSSSASDLLVSGDVVAMLLVAHALAPQCSDAYEELLSAQGQEIVLWPASRYTSEATSNFAEIHRSAQAHGELAIGLVQGDDTLSLRPDFACVVRPDDGTRVVVLSPPAEDLATDRFVSD